MKRLLLAISLWLAISVPIVAALMYWAGVR